MSGLEKLGPLTAELVDKMVDQLIRGGNASETGQLAVSWLKDNKDALIGIGVDEFAKVVGSIGDENFSYLAAQRAYINSLPLATAQKYYDLTVEDLRQHTDPALRLGSVFKTIAEYGLKIAPKILGAAVALI